MAPHTPRRELLGQYSEALLAYLQKAHIPALSQARELGNTALINGLCAAELCAIHHESLRQIGAQIPRVTDDAEEGRPQSRQSLHTEDLVPLLAATPPPVETITAAGRFLAESLEAFEADQEELRRLNLALRRQNDRLEAELRRVTKVIYDEALQLVSATRLVLAGSDGIPTPPVWKLLDKLEEQLVQCSGSLQPRVLEDLGLASAVQFLSKRFASACELDIIADTTIGPLPPAVSIALYRSVLEALTNVHRHARARKVQIRLCEDCSMIQCSIRDDGIGFDISQALSEAEVQGSGFVFIQESLRLVGGTLVVDSAPGGGTELKISICPRTRN